MSSLRLYSFTNMYLSSVQKGLQTAHMVSKMSVAITDPATVSVANMYSEWANVDNTIIILNGGSDAKMHDILYHKILPFRMELPVGFFYESKEALNGVLTSVGIIVPETLLMRDEFAFIRNAPLAI